MKLELNYLEKYRPKTRKNIVGNKVVIDRIFNQIDSGHMVDMLFTGVYGIGKTATARVIGMEALRNYYSTDYIEFNASSKTGIDNIRNNVIDVMELRPYGDFWLFVMDEAEKLSEPSQNAMKKAMENRKKTSRFIWICNNMSKIIPAIVNRCRVYYFMSILPHEMISRLKYIRDQEDIPIENKLLLKLAEMANGSMRYPIIMLEELNSLGREIVESDIRMEKSLENISGIFSLLKNKKLVQARGILINMYKKGHYFSDIIRYFHDFTVMSLKDVTNYKTKAQCLIEIAKTERNVKEGCNEFIQISSLLSKISLNLQNIEINKNKNI